MVFNFHDNVECIDDTSTTFLTKGEIYTVYGCEDDISTIISNNGVFNNYLAERFKLVAKTEIDYFAITREFS